MSSVKTDVIFAKAQQEKEKDKRRQEYEQQMKTRYKHNWRIDMLSIPKNHPDELEMFPMSEQEKHDYIDRKKSERDLEIKRSKSKIEDDKERMRHLYLMSLQSPRYYQLQKQANKHLGKKFAHTMEKNYEAAYNSPYNEYNRARIALKKKEKHKGKRSAKKKSPKKSKEQLEAWCKRMATPKQFLRQKEAKIDRGKIADLAGMAERINEISKPTRVYVRPSQDSMSPEKIIKVKPGALTYKATENIIAMAQPPPRFFITEEPYIPGHVPRSALTFKASPRLCEIALPHKRAAAKEADVNEDAFKINPNALKYVATPRIIELAKPHEREF